MSYVEHWITLVPYPNDVSCKLAATLRCLGYDIGVGGDMGGACFLAKSKKMEQRTALVLSLKTYRFCIKGLL